MMNIMLIKPVLLWTDVLIYLLVFSALLFVVYALRHAQLRRSWRYVFSSRIGMGAFIVLSCYITVALLDSIHFRLPTEQSHYSMKVYSLLDIAIAPIGERSEKSYSAPLATHLYSKTTIIDADGRRHRMYPPLQLKQTHIPPQLLASVTKVLTAWLLLYILFYYLKRRSSHPSAWPWRTAFFTVGILLSTIILLQQFSSYYYVLGTDKIGHEVLYQAIKSIRTGLIIGTLTTLIMLPFAVLLGTLAGCFRGVIDDIIQYLYTTLSSIPGILLIAATILSLQVAIDNHPDFFASSIVRADMRLLTLCAILGVASWTGLCRLIRAESFKLYTMDYVKAADALGRGRFHIITQHILPNLSHIILITITLDFSGLVLAEAVLSYVGVGVDPLTMSWGNMINAARLEMAREPVVWWPLLAAFGFMFFLVLAANLFADVVRDAFDPRV